MTITADTADSADSAKWGAVVVAEGRMKEAVEFALEVWSFVVTATKALIGQIQWHFSLRQAGKKSDGFTNSWCRAGYLNPLWNLSIIIKATGSVQLYLVTTNVHHCSLHVSAFVIVKSSDFESVKISVA